MIGLLLMAAGLFLAATDWGDGVFDWWAISVVLIVVGFVLDRQTRRVQRARATRAVRR